ncbi:InlB B-repeat-containing protein [Bifidobacterium sp. B4142]|uniref:RCC1 domain-containing protein n=1 Tax=Bifidobacterium sp. B4142 TaxID=2817962 RepID=UPI00226B8A00|nr:InlB B-repeat-containing protein [Bifidobacterium sp. B4142]MCX8686567.1 InlB B-repeat-containing protein [Bifidobacterium sp. B4142]
MRQRPSLAAAALAILLALSCAPALAGGFSSPSEAATPATLGNARQEEYKPPRADSRQFDAAGSTLTAAPSSSPLATSSPLSHTTPTPASPTRGTSGDAATAQARSSAAWTVSFDTAGGGSVDQQTIPDGGQASRPSPDPSRGGYLFDGWFQGDIAYDFTQPVTSSITLTARWTKADTQHWAISPTQGPAAGGAKFTLTPPAQRGIKFSQASLGYMHSAAIGSDGSLYTWGRNSEGQLGDGTNTDRTRPVQVEKPQGASDGFTWTQVSLGDYYSVAMGSDGQLYAWGSNNYGQLGDGTNTDRTRPVQVEKPQGASDGFTWKQVDIGWYHSAGIGSDGNLYTWGWNYYGQLGDGTNTDRNTPTLVGKPQGAPDGFTWKQVSLGGRHSGAIGSDNNLYTWGWNSNGQLGDGTTTDRNRPGVVDKPQGASDGFTWTQASLGGWHSAAMGSDGRLYACGLNFNGQLGDGTTTDSYRPVQVVNPAGAPAGFTWEQASLGNSHSSAFGSDGQLYTWGWNQYGQLGDGTTTDRSTPTLVGKPQGAPAGFTWKYAILGRYHSAAFGSDGNLYTWGENNPGQLGRDVTEATPQGRPGVVVFPGAATPTDVLFGQARTMGGITPNPDGTWQASTPAHAPGAVDVRVVWNRNGPQPDAHLQYTFIAPEHQVGFTSKDSSCPAPTGMPPSQAVTQDGQAERPQPDPKADGCLFDGWFQDNVAYDFSQPVTHSITLTARWTRTDTQHWTISPAQGPEAGGTKVTLTPPTPRGVRFSQTSFGSFHSAGIASDGNLYTWGYNSKGQLGDGTTSSRSTPVQIGKPQGAPAGFTWKQVSLGGFHSAAIGSDGQLYTWGNNSSGQLGDGTTTSRSTPVKVGKPAGAPDGFTWKQVSLGDQHSAAIGSDGQLYTWGWNQYGQLGDGTTTSRSTPVKVGKPQGAPDGFAWKQASLGDQHSAAIGSDGNLYTWGYNFNGQLGDGTTTSRSTPVQIGKPQGAPDGFTWTQVSLGNSHSSAFGSDGQLYTWGWNQYGQLGDGTQVDKRTPTQVGKPQGAPDGFTWKQASLGRWYSAAIGSDDSLYTWGSNGDGQLGDGTTTSQNRPVLVGRPAGAPDGFTWTQASLGFNHSAALGSDGSLYTWGSNSSGQLGREPAEAWPASRPGPVGFPGKPQATSICFDQTRQQGVCSAAGKNLTPNPDGTWNATTPAYTPGPVPAAIDWTQDGRQQQTDTSNTYRYLSIASLPLTGGNGMLLLLATGLLAAGAAAAAKNRRQQTQTHTSHE